MHFFAVFPKFLCCNEQVYVALEGLEGSLGLDPKDPIVPFVLVLGTSATLWYEFPFSHTMGFIFFLLSLYCVGNLYFLSDLVQGLLLGVDL